MLGVVVAARRLSEAPPPEARGVGAGLVEREIGALRRDIAGWTAGTEVLAAALRTPYRLLVAGPSQVGKSTLINVIAGHRVLPTSGAGDAKTLKETLLQYSAEGQRALRVEYISTETANQRRFKLESFARRRPEYASSFSMPWADGEAARAEESEETVTIDDDADVDRDVHRAYAALVEQIRILVYPEVREPELRAQLPDPDRNCLEVATHADWVDAWRLLLGQKLVAGGRFAELWRPRIEDAAALLGTTREINESEVDEKEFKRVVEEHTAGRLALMVEKVLLALPSPDLELMDVEDLPGVGNYQDPASDVARSVLSSAMKERDLDGLLVVASQAGLDANTVSLVEENAVLRRVLEGGTDLALAVTHVDAMAKAEAQRLEDEGMEDDDFPSNDEILASIRGTAEKRQLEKLRRLFEEQISDVDESERTALLQQVLGRTRIVGVEASAAEAYRFNLRRKTQEAFAESLESTGVPELISHFRSQAERRHAERMTRAQEQTERIRESVDKTLSRIQKDHDLDTAVELAAAARDAYLRALEVRKVKLSNTWATQRAHSEAHLKRGVPAEVARTNEKARSAAGKKQTAVIRRCRTGGRNGRLIHWATMKAALKRGGTWNGAHHLDLPGDLAGALMRPFLKGWRDITGEVESLLQTYHSVATEFLRTLASAAEEAATEAGLEADAGAVDAAHAQLASNMEGALAVVAASVDQLNQSVPSQLRAVLNNHFERECERVLKRTRSGNGYTERLLQGYEDVGQSAIEKGVTTGGKVLEAALGELSDQIRETLFEADPVAFAYRRLKAAVHDTAEPPEVLEARAALVEWARAHSDWASAPASS